ncbi:MAG TPA: uridine kinase [Acidimicrobiia bacterium]|nr:uridine kinase [Acidimicrobiia bacterium]
MAARTGSESDVPLIVGIAGGSGSGKTTIASSLVDQMNGQVALVQHDAYYRHTPQLSFEDRSKVNYDHPASLETELLVAHLVSLRSGEPVEKPSYDFASHLRSDEVVMIAPAPVILVEGILVLAEPGLRDELDLKVFVDTDADIRLARRLERDIEERGRTVTSVIAQYFASVRPMHMEFVEPSKGYADVIIEDGFTPEAVDVVIEMIRSQRGRDFGPVV